MSILLVAEDDEPNLPGLNRACEWAGIESVTLNPYLLSKSTISWSPWDSGFLLTLPTGASHLSHEWTGIWARRSKWPTLDINHVGERFAAIESIYLWNALVSSLSDVCWMNPAASITKWDNRLIQMKLARSLGWQVPETIVCTDPDIAKQFLAQHGEIVVKHLSAGGNTERADRLLFTKMLKSNDDYARDALNHVIWCPTLLQKSIRKVVEVRAIVVNDRVFSAGIQPLKDSRSEVDGRLWIDTKLRFSRIDLGNAIERKLIELTQAMGFTYGAADLMIDEKEDIYFLELNCSGQWGFVEQVTGYPITEKIIFSLCGHE